MDVDPVEVVAYKLPVHSDPGVPSSDYRLLAHLALYSACSAWVGELYAVVVGDVGRPASYAAVTVEDAGLDAALGAAAVVVGAVRDVAEDAEKGVEKDVEKDAETDAGKGGEIVDEVDAGGETVVAEAADDFAAGDFAGNVELVVDAAELSAVSAAAAASGDHLPLELLAVAVLHKPVAVERDGGYQGVDVGH